MLQMLMTATVDSLTQELILAIMNGMHLILVQILMTVLGQLLEREWQTPQQ